MKVDNEIKITRTVTLTLTNEEADWLRKQMSVKNGLDSNIDQTMKRQFFETLRLDRVDIIAKLPAILPPPVAPVPAPQVGRIHPTSLREPLI